MENWLEACADELWRVQPPTSWQLDLDTIEGIIERHHAPCASAAKVAAERIAELEKENELSHRIDQLTAAARYLMLALHGCAEKGWSRAEIAAVARNAAEKWPELAPGAQPTTPPRDSRSSGAS